MKKENVKKATKVMELIEKIDKTIPKIEQALQKSGNSIDSGSILNDLDSIGYNVYLSEHSDGSGFKIDMTGLYVGVEMLEATRTVLYAKKDMLIEYGKKIGIEF